MMAAPWHQRGVAGRRCGAAAGSLSIIAKRACGVAGKYAEDGHQQFFCLWTMLL